jgi:hypothetical protein
MLSLIMTFEVKVGRIRCIGALKEYHLGVKRLTFQSTTIRYRITGRDWLLVKIWHGLEYFNRLRQHVN